MEEALNLSSDRLLDDDDDDDDDGSVLRMKNVTDENCTDNQNTNFTFNDWFSKIVPFMR